jgi:hypothetical protein
MLTIPEIRERLFVLAVELDCPELAELAEGTKRRSPVKRAPVTSRPMTPQLAIAVRAYQNSHPDMSQQEIARVFHLNNGRISEALRGYREEG